MLNMIYPPSSKCFMKNIQPASMRLTVSPSSTPTSSRISSFNSNFSLRWKASSFSSCFFSSGFQVLSWTMFSLMAGSWLRVCESH